MKLLDSHIRNTVLLATAAVIALVMSLELVFALADEAEKADDAYSMGHVFLFVLMTTPTRIYELLPFAALGGALIGLGVLASNNELVVMQAAGIRDGRIIYSVLKPAFGIMLLGLVLGEYVAPPLEHRAQSRKAVLQSAGRVSGGELSVWQKIGDGYVHINAIRSEGEELSGISLYELDDGRRLRSASFAESARYVRDDSEAGDDSDGHWRLHNVRRTLLAEDGISSETVAQEVWQVYLPPELLRLQLVEPDHQSISGLWELARFFERQDRIQGQAQTQGQSSSVYYLAFWKKLLQPLATLSLVILAVSFVFGPLREVTMGYRVFVALAVGLVFTIAQRMMEPVSLLFGFSPALATLTPIAVCAAVGMGLLLRK